MTISSKVRKAGPYTGNGATKSFPFSFKVFQASEVVVIRTDLTGAETTLTLTTDYTISLNANQDTNPGGTINMLTAPPSGYLLTATSGLQDLQPVALTNMGGFYPRVINDALDRVTILIQQLSEKVSRAVKNAISAPVGINPTLPAPVPYALIGWNSTGDGFQNTDPTYSTALATDLANSASGMGASLVAFLAPDGSSKSVADLSSATPGKGSGLVGFIQSGTGAVARTSQDKLREIVSVLDFGAKGDGSTDDTAVFSNATALGAPVLVPYTSTFYKLTALTNGQRALLWGPGVVKVNGVVTPIASAPTFASVDLAGTNVVKPALTPAQWPGIVGSLGNGAANFDVTRSGGYGTYGSVLSRLLVTAPVVANEFDVASTAWVTTTNLTQTGAAAFGGWFGANTPSKNLGQTYTGGFAVGQEINVGNRWADLGLQLDIGGTRWTAGQTISPDVLPSSDGIDAVSVSSITIASPGVVTINAHGFIANQGIVFNGSGTLPNGLTKGQVYYVSSAGLTANAFQVCSTPGGAPINTTGSFVAPITATPSWAGSFGQVIARSIWGHRWWVGTLIRYDSIVPTGHAHYECGGSVTEMAPASWTKLAGYWQNGIDLSAAVCSGAAINFSFSNSNATTATAGSIASPGNFQGFIKVAMGGTIIKIPYFQN